ncbi:MAG: hypothetical protein ACLUIO_19325 [Neglectibacter timonensis]
MIYILGTLGLTSLVLGAMGYLMDAPQEGAQGAAGAEKAGGGGGLSAQPGAIRKAALRLASEKRRTKNNLNRI